MAAVTICSDFGAQKIKSDTVSTISPSICHEVMGPDAMILVFWILSFVFFKLFFIEGNCFTEFCFFSVKPQHESATGIQISPPFWTSLLSPTPLGWYRALDWVSRVILQIPIGYLFYIWYRKFPCYSFHTSHPLLLRMFHSLLWSTQSKGLA